MTMTMTSVSVKQGDAKIIQLSSLLLQILCQMIPFINLSGSEAQLFSYQ